MNPSRVLPAFSAAFIILYVVAMNYNLALFTYHPALKRFELLAAQPKGGPAMYWYGWAATAALGALMAGLVAASLPGRSARHFWSGWVWLIPALSMIACVYLTLPWFRL